VSGDPENGKPGGIFLAPIEPSLLFSFKLKWELFFKPFLFPWGHVPAASQPLCSLPSTFQPLYAVGTSSGAPVFLCVPLLRLEWSPTLYSLQNSAFPSIPPISVFPESPVLVFHLVCLHPLFTVGISTRLSLLALPESQQSPG
jgi:hypothetical protein